MKKFVLSLAFLFLLFSCVNEPKGDLPLYPVNNYTVSENRQVKLSSIFKEVRMVPLETNASSLIGGRGNKVLQRDSLFYVHSQNKILCFGYDGRFVQQWDKQGNGPGEYSEISDFDVVVLKDKKKELWISGANGILIYDLPSGNYLRDIPIGKYVHQFQCVNDHTVLIITFEDKILQVCDLNGNIRQEFMEKDLANTSHKFNQFFKYKNKIAYQLGDTQSAIVYDSQKDECSLCAILPVEKNVLTPEISRDYYDKYGYMQQYEHMQQTCMLLSTIRTVGDNVFLTWMLPDKERAFSILSSFECKTYAYSDVINDVFSSDDNMFLSTIICCDSDNPSTLLFQVPMPISGGDEGVEEANFALLEVKLTK